MKIGMKRRGKRIDQYFYKFFLVCKISSQKPVTKDTSASFTVKSKIHFFCFIQFFIRFVFDNCLRHDSVVNFYHVVSERVQSGCMQKQIDQIFFSRLIEANTFRNHVFKGKIMLVYLLKQTLYLQSVLIRYKIILVFELSIECGGGIATVVSNILYTDFVDIILLSEFQKGFNQNFSCCFPFH